MPQRTVLIKIFLGVALCFNFQVFSQDQKSQPLQVGFLLVDGVYNTEVIAPFDVLQHTIFHATPGMEVFTVAPARAVITTFEGLKIQPDYAFDDSNLPNIDILIVASAEHSMDSDLTNRKLVDFVKEKGLKARFVMSLCDGAFVLAKAGLIDGRESTTFPADIARYQEMFPHLKVHKEVSFVHDGPLITSAGGVKSYDAAMYLVEVLYGKQVAQNIGKGLIIDWDLQNIRYHKVLH